MDKIKEAFQAVKQEIDFLLYELDSLKQKTSDNNQKIKNIFNKLDILDQKISSLIQTHIPTHTMNLPTIQTHIPTQNEDFKPLNTQNKHISIGNKGVPTDRQTNRQTNRQTQNQGILRENSFEEIIGALDSLDSMKKEIRLKFKRLTEMELLVFSTIYQLEEELDFVDYKTLSNKLNLSESSIRDYIGKLIKKGIPVDKIKINNKSIQIKISENLRKIISLDAILHLRDL